MDIRTLVGLGHLQRRKLARIVRIPAHACTVERRVLVSNPRRIGLLVLEVSPVSPVVIERVLALGCGGQVIFGAVLSDYPALLVGSGFGLAVVEDLAEASTFRGFGGSVVLYPARAVLKRDRKSSSLVSGVISPSCTTKPPWSGESGPDQRPAASGSVYPGGCGNLPVCSKKNILFANHA